MRSPDLHWVEVEKTVFLSKHIHHAFNLDSLVKDFVLDTSSKFDFFLVLRLQIRSLILDFVDLVVQFPNDMLCFTLLFVYSSFYVNILLLLLGYKLVKQLYLGLIFLVLAIGLIDDQFFLLNFALSIGVLLLLDKSSYSLHFLQCLCRRFKPFHI